MNVSVAILFATSLTLGAAESTGPLVIRGSVPRIPYVVAASTPDPLCAAVQIYVPKEIYMPNALKATPPDSRGPRRVPDVGGERDTPTIPSCVEAPSVRVFHQK